MQTPRVGTATGRIVPILLALVALALFALISVQALKAMPSFDGAMNMQVALNLAEGEGYKRSYAAQQPFPREIQTNGAYILAAALGYRLFGLGVAQSQLPNLLFLALLCTVAFVLVRGMRGRSGDGLLAAIMVLATPLLLELGLRGFGEVPGLSLALGGLALYPWKEPHARGRMLAAAMLLGAAVVTKTVMLVCVAPIGLVMALHAASRSRAPSARMLDLVLLAAGFIAPIVAWEAFRMASLGGLGAYKAWWTMEYASISREAGIAPTARSSLSQLPAKVAEHFGILAANVRLPTPIALAWLLLPFGLAFAIPASARHARWIVLATLAAAAAYFIWWLAITPTPKAWNRRIFNGILLVNIAWVLVAAAIASGGLSRLRQGVAMTAMALSACLAIAFLYQSRASGDFSAGDQRPMARAIALVKALPPDAQLFAAGWSSAPQISLLADRPFRDINDVDAAELAGIDEAYLVVDPAGGHTLSTRRILAMYPSVPLLDGQELPQVYRFSPRTLTAAPAVIEASVPTPFQSLDDSQAIGFHIAESQGRWASADGALRAVLSPQDSIRIEAYVLEDARYAAGVAPTVSVSVGDCALPPVKTHPGAQTLEFPVAPCAPDGSEPSTIRIRSDQLLESAITIDERPLAFIARSILIDQPDQ